MLLGSPKARHQTVDAACRGVRVNSVLDVPVVSQPEPQQHVREGVPLTRITLADMPNDLLARISTWLRARDLANLACLSRRLAVHTEDACKRKLAACTSKELAWISAGHQCALSRLHEIEILRSPPCFVRAHESMAISDNRIEVLQDPTRRSRQAARSWSSSARAAASGALMKRGSHYAEFLMVRGTDLMVGVVHSSWDVKSPAFAHGALCCVSFLPDLRTRSV